MNSTPAASTTLCMSVLANRQALVGVWDPLLTLLRQIHPDLNLITQQILKTGLYGLHPNCKLNLLQLTAAVSTAGTITHVIELYDDLPFPDCNNANLIHLVSFNPNSDSTKKVSSEKVVNGFRDGSSPLHAAAASGNFERLTALVDSNPALVATTNSRGELPIHYAYLFDHAGIIGYLSRHPLLHNNPHAEDKARSIRICADILLTSLKDFYVLEEFANAAKLLVKSIEKQNLPMLPANLTTQLDLYLMLIKKNIQADQITLAIHYWNKAVDIIDIIPAHFLTEVSFTQHLMNTREKLAAYCREIEANPYRLSKCNDIDINRLNRSSSSEYFPESVDDPSSAATNSTSTAQTVDFFEIHALDATAPAP